MFAAGRIQRERPARPPSRFAYDWIISLRSREVNGFRTPKGCPISLTISCVCKACSRFGIGTFDRGSKRRPCRGRRGECAVLESVCGNITQGAR
jgi:hypothetical protein